MKGRYIWLLAATLAAVAASGCQTIDEKRRIDYRGARTLPPLEVPPDLTTLPGDKASAGAATYSEYVNERKAQQPAQTSGTNSPVLPRFPDMKIERAGTEHWLVVHAAPEELWPKLREFILNNGLLIAKENPATGVLETEWAENRANVGSGSQKLFAKWFNGVYATGLRDKYRIRAERGEETGTTDIYVTHRGMKEVVASGGGTNVTQTMWEPRPSDPELEAEMLHLLMVHLGMKEKTAETNAVAAVTAPVEERAKLTKNGNGSPLLSLQDSLDRAWRRVGLSLDRIGFTVEDRDRSKGIYYVRYIDPDNPEKKTGLFSRLFGGKNKGGPKNEYQIRLTEAEAGTDIEVLDKEGVLETSKTGRRILGLLYEQLK